jgi:hypothetical protein
MTKESDMRTKPQATVNGYQSRVFTSTMRLAGWSCAWVAATALMKFGPRLLWKQAVVFTLLAGGLDVAVGVGMILANKRYLADLDELQQKIYLNSLGITVGVAVIVSIPLSVLDLYHLSPFHPEISHLLVLMSLTFIVSILYGTWRYR